jgi:hypothetical protein
MSPRSDAATPRPPPLLVAAVVDGAGAAVVVGARLVEVGADVVVAPPSSSPQAAARSAITPMSARVLLTSPPFLVVPLGGSTPSDRITVRAARRRALARFG